MRLTTLFSLAIAVSPLSVLASSGPKQCSSIAVRKEWRDLSDEEKKSFISAFKCLGNKPHTSRLKPSGATPDIPPVNASAKRTDDFVYLHADTNIKDHFTAIFFPWHRWFLHTFQTELEKECGYKGEIPFWDWTRDVKDMKASPVFNSSKTYGLGTLGEAPNYDVRDGAFGNTILAYPTPHYLKRNYTNYPFRKQSFPFMFIQADLPATDALTPEVIKKIVNGSAGNYTDFAYNIDGVRAQGPHNAAHLMMGGDLEDPYWSPNDPLFWLHHAQLDCIWARWQKRRKSNAKAYGGGLTQDLTNYDRYPVGSAPWANTSSVIPTGGLSESYRVSDVMSTKSPKLCYVCDY